MFLAALFAASRPDRMSHLVMVDPSASWTQDEEMPWEWPPERWDQQRDLFRNLWGVLSSERLEEERAWLAEHAPSVKLDERELGWRTRMERATMGPGASVAELGKFREIDIRGVLPSIHVPTLVIHRRGDPVYDPRSPRYVADHIEHARYVEVDPAPDGWPWSRGWEALTDEIEEFMVGTRRGPAPNRVLTTVLFTDIVGSTAKAAELGDAEWHQLLQRHHAVVRAELTRYEGVEQDTAGYGFFAEFDGPARALRCAEAISAAVRVLGVDVRIGLHTGECEIVDGKRAASPRSSAPA